MTANEIATLANKGSIALADFDLQKTLRRVVIPKFLLDVDRIVGTVHWRRATWSQAVSVGTRDYNLPTDWERFELLKLNSAAGLKEAELVYIGEDPNFVLEAEAATIVEEPSSYYIIAGFGSTPPPFALRLGAPTDAAYTLLAVYYRLIPFTDDSEDTELNAYIPLQYQAALVCALQTKIFEDRFGIGDGRYVSAQAEYRDWLVSMSQKKEPAPRRHAVFVR